jgi:hypothetical protein
MDKVVVLTAAAVFFVHPATAMAGELPGFEKSGFPITQVQVSVLGAADVEERSPTPGRTLHGMPASPHQLAVLTPRQMHVKTGVETSPSRPGSRDVTAYRTSGE